MTARDDRSGLQVRSARPAEWSDLGRVLGGAFQDDPIWSWICPDPDRRREHLAGLFAQLIKARVASGWGWTTELQEGAAVWAAPGAWKTGTSEMLRCAVPAIRAAGLGNLRTRIGALTQMEKAHPREPHWYLEFLAARVDLRGKGVGSTLMAPMIERCDTEGMPAYLESSKEENLAFYHRFGFEVTEEAVIAPGCPPLWRMWRNPH